MQQKYFRDRMADLMGYLVETVNNTKKYRCPSWLVYDQNFCQLMATRKDEVWMNMDAGIYAQCFVGQHKSVEAWCKTCQLIKHNTSSCPVATYGNGRPPSQRADGGAEPKRSSTISKNFNMKDYKFNNNCYRRHTCSECLGPHPIFKCPNIKDISPAQ